MSIPTYWQAWDTGTLQPVNVLRGGKPYPLRKIQRPAHWRMDDGTLVTDTPGSKIEMDFKGTHVAVVGEAGPTGGYARISVLDARQDTVYSSLVDYYSKHTETAIRVITPRKPHARYTLCIEATGIIPVWTDKSKNIFGSKGCQVNIHRIYTFKK